MDYLTFLLFLCFLWFCSLIFFPRTSTQSHPPGPRLLSVVGNVFKLRARPHRALADLARRYGPVMSLRFGTMTTVVISSSSAAKVIQMEALSSRMPPDAITACDHHRYSFVWSPASSKWNSLSKLLSEEIFKPEKLKSTENIRRSKVDELLSYIHESSAQGRPVYIGQVAFTTVLNIISNMVFSVNLVEQGTSSAREFKEVIWGLMKEGVSPNVSDFFPVLRVLDLQGIRRRTTKYMSRLFEQLDDMILERTKNSTKDRRDVLDCLLHSQERCEITRNDVKSVLADLIVAGVDTTQILVEWAMAELLKNPRKLERVRSELRRVLGSSVVVQDSDIPKLSYLDAVIKETLRLHVIFLTPRKTNRDVHLGDFTVPKDTKILVNNWAIGHDPDLWTNPDSFEPERFLDPGIDPKGGSELIPFGAGRRSCPGQLLARKMLPMIVGSLVHSFDWKLVNGETPETMDMDEMSRISMVKATPLVAIPVKL